LVNQHKRDLLGAARGSWPPEVERRFIQTLPGRGLRLGFDRSEIALERRAAVGRP